MQVPCLCLYGMFDPPYVGQRKLLLCLAELLVMHL